MLRRKIRAAFRRMLEESQLTQLAIHTELRALREEMAARTPDNPALKGFKAYSQFDEDGVIEEIFNRIGRGATFLEIGCGDGLENNSHYLLLKGWSGMWVDGSSTSIEKARANLPPSPSLEIVQQRIDLTNVEELGLRYSSRFGQPDFLSVDIDGNDLHVLKAVLTVLRPAVICVEYAAKLPPPIAATVEYDPAHTWSGDDYHGASVQAYVDALPDFRLVACNLCGANAFFVRNDLADRFAKYSAAELYQPARFHLCQLKMGHPPSYKFLAAALKARPAGGPASAARST
jgi:hypothetical protein